MDEPVDLKMLGKDQDQQHRLHHQIVTRGFALIHVQDPDRTRALDHGLLTAAQLSGFRFPPINVDEVRYEEPHREAFRALYATALECLVQLSDDDMLKQTSTCHTQTLAQLHPELFSTSPHEPFPEGHSFHPTFFNLFNYDHGALNSHKDRGLLTIIYIKPAHLSQTDEASALWVSNAEGAWTSADQAIINARTTQSALINDHDHLNHLVILLIGEEGEVAFKDVYPHLFAAEHSVRVHPEGAYIEHSHYLRDPTSRERANRLSAALILKRS